jgi:hypothetical protein
MLLAKDVHELTKWAHRASRFEMWMKLQAARVITKERRLVCLVAGCRNRDSAAPCSRCGAR